MSGSWFQVFCVVDGSHFAMLLTEQHFWSVDQLRQNHSRFAFVCLWIRVLSLFKLPVSWSEARKQESKVEREIPCHGSTEGIPNYPDFLGQWPWNIIYQVKYTFYKMLCSSWLYLKDSYHHVVRKNPGPDCGDGLRSLGKLWKSSLVPNSYFDSCLSVRCLLEDWRTAQLCSLAVCSGSSLEEFLTSPLELYTERVAEGIAYMTRCRH